ncbi:hypothetical protein Q9Q93_22680 (plasmid) [Enterobacter hormaechei]|uniref:hypothetical protein n=1 Tax=Enterobacter hormaechei TaxID=158836 RepID=UPI000A3B9787|nr:hypothetical protein [Enterobacter hormaechei]MCE1525654.1 hypothetical protein [Enterobacter hormaechei]OUF18813.1 hypothetical protein AZ045_004376 [Enterobacter hormaechei]WLR86752.1 hypothetical protein Q9Q93_22680 [Enterobacter hormaechei]HCR0932443.1 hypothetical protein [Enterobacter hormaechei]HEM8052208.1 hypothetical protein [Enterobacter hormaechei]
MSVKTEAKKPAAEISLFDAFGPDVSEQVQAINLRAAELSMGDMARVMGVKELVKKKPALPTAHDEDADSYDPLIAWLGSQECRSGVTFQVSNPLVEGCLMSPHGLGKIVPTATALTAGYMRRHTTFTFKGHQGIQEVMDAVSSKLHHLQDVGADESTFTVSIRYKDPKTGSFVTETLEPESGLSSGPFAAPKQQIKKTRKRGREIVMHTLIAKK